MYRPGRLFALEVNTREAVEEFKSVLRGLGGGKKGGKKRKKNGGLMGQLELGEFADVLETNIAVIFVLRLSRTRTHQRGER
jgi:hypothetical protein